MAAALLVYFLPILIQALERLSVSNLIDQVRLRIGPFSRLTQHHFEHLIVSIPGFDWSLSIPRAYGSFVLVAVASGLLVGSFGWWSVRRDWQIKLDQRLIVSVLGGVAIFLFFITASQVGNNLSADEQYLHAPDRTHPVGRMIMNNGHGVLGVYDNWPINYTPKMGLRHHNDALIQGSHLYVLTDHGMTVFDLSDPSHPRRVGHYAAPKEDFRALAPLPDGRVAVAGRSIHIVSPPRGD